MKFQNEKLGVSFEIEDVITVPMQLMYEGLAENVDGVTKYINLWGAARHYVEKWECEFFPDPSVAISNLTDPRVAKVIKWAGQQVYDHITGLAEVPND